MNQTVKYTGTVLTNPDPGRFYPCDDNGELTFSDGRKYKGPFNRGRMEGDNATFIYPNGDIYVGEFIDTVENGKGKLTIQSGIYEGQIENGLPHGKGHFIWNNGSSYYGDFLEGQMTGKGTITYENGEKYIGEFKNGYKHGNGVYQEVNGNQFDCEFADDQLVSAKH